jgi:hypothetical protein
MAAMIWMAYENHINIRVSIGFHRVIISLICTSIVINDNAHDSKTFTVDANPD